MSEPFVISGDASPLVRELERASAALRKFGNQEIPGPKVGGATGAGGTILGGLGTSLERAYADVRTRATRAQQDLYNTLASTPAGGRANLQAATQYRKIAEDNVRVINEAARAAVSRGAPVDLVKMFATQGIEGIFSGLKAEMTQLQSQARALATASGVKYTGLGGFGEKSLARSSDAALRTLESNLRLGEQKYTSFRRTIDDLSLAFSDLKSRSKSIHDGLASDNAKAKAAVQAHNEQLHRQLLLEQEIAKTRGIGGRALSINPAAASQPLAFPAGAPGGVGGRRATLQQYVSTLFPGASGGIRAPAPPFAPFDQKLSAGLAAPGTLLDFLLHPNISGRSVGGNQRVGSIGALDAIGAARTTSPQLSNSQRLLISATQSRVDSLQRETALSGAHQTIQRLVSREMLQQALSGNLVAPPGFGGGSGGSGGGGGGGGLYGGAAGGGRGRVGVVNSFLGGLTSRGFSQGSGFNFNFEDLAGTAGNTAKYAALSLAIYGVLNATREGAKEFLDYRDSLTDVAAALATTQGEFEALRGSAVTGGGLVSSPFENQLQEYSRVAGTNVGAQLDAAARGIRAFGDVVGEQRDNPEILKQLGTATAEAVTQLATITKTDYKDQTGNIIAVAQAYGLQADELSRVVDAVANSRSLGGDMAQTSQGLANFATIAVESGLSLQEAANLISAIQAKTDQGGQLIATRLTRISQIINGAGGQRVLKNIGVDTSQGLLQQLNELSGKYTDGSLTEDQQKALTSRLAGTANAREFNVALKEMGDILEASDPRFAKAGAGAQLFNNILSDFAGTLRKIRGDIKNLVLEVANSGAFDLLVLSIKLLEPGLKAIVDLLGQINGIGGQTGRLFRGGIFGLVEITAAIALYRKFRDARRGAGVGAGVAGVAAGAGATGAAVGSNAVAAAASTEAKANQVATQVMLSKINAYRFAAVQEGQRIATLIAITEAQLRSNAAELAGTLTAEQHAAATKAQTLAKVSLNSLLIEESINQAILNQRTLEYIALREAAVVADKAAAVSLAALSTTQTTGAMTGLLGPGFGPIVGRPGDPLRRGASRFTERIDRRFPDARIDPATGERGGYRRPGFGGVLGAFIALTVLDQVIGNLAGAGKRATEATNSTVKALDKLGDTTLSTPEGLRGRAESLRNAADKSSEAGSGFFAGFKDITGAPDPSDFAGNLRKLANQADDQADVLERAETRSAVKGQASVFQDIRSVEGLTAGIEALDAVGTSATRTIDLLTQALGGVVAESSQQGAILPGQLPVIKDELLSQFQQDLRAAYIRSFVDTDAGESQIGNDIDAPQLRKKRSEGNGLLPFGNPLDDTKLEFLGAPSARIDLSPRQAGKENAYEELFAEGGKGITEARNAARKAINKFFKRADIGAQGGILTPQQQNELAEAIASAYTPKDLSPEQLKIARRDLELRARKFIRNRLDPAKVIVDQETSSFVQKTLVDNAGKASQQRGVGDADAVRAARRRQANLKAQIDELPGSGRAEGVPNIAAARQVQARREQLEKGIIEAQAAEKDALNNSGQTSLQLARTELATILDAEQTALSRGTEVDAATIQAELEARRKVADALEEEKQAQVEYTKSLLGAQDEIGRARADLNETLRQAAVAQQNNDPAAAARLRAQANDQAAALPRLYAERDSAAAVAALNPGDAIGQAREELEATKRQLSTVTVRGEDGQFTKEYLDLIAQLKNNARAVVQARVDRDTQAALAGLDPRDELGRAQAALDATKRQFETVTVRGSDGEFTQEYLALVTQLAADGQALVDVRAQAINSQRSAFTNPGNAGDVAATAVVNAATLLNTAKYGTDQYYQYLAQLNQAKLAYAEEEQRGIEANIVKRGGTDRLSRANTAVELARSRLRFTRRKARGDYDTSGNLVGEAPNFGELGEGIGSQFAEGVAGFDYAQLGAEEVSDQLVNGITSVDYFALGQALATDLTDGILGAMDVAISELEIMTSKEAAGGRRSPDSIDRSGRVSVTSPQYSGGVSSINTSQSRSVAPGSVAVSQQYGNRSSRYADGVHKGVDIAAPYGSPVLSATGGKVVSAGDGGAYGNTILIKAPDGTLHRYGHLSKLGVQEGDKIRGGQRIGSVGSTGNSTGNHLHYEVSKDGRTVDPEKYLEGTAGKGGDRKSGKNGKLSPAEVAEREAEYQEALEQQRLAQIDLAKAKINAKVDPRSALSAARARIKTATLDLKAYAKGTIEYYEALAALREAQYALAQQLAELRAARRQASVFPGDAVRQARVDIKNAADQLKLTKKGTTEWYQAYAEWQNAQVSLTAAIIEAQKTRFLLNHDFTNPLVQARADTRAAESKLARDQKAGAPKRVIEADKLAVEQAQANQEQVAFDQRLQQVQTNERLGRISHQAYLTYLNNEKSRLEAIASRTYQQQQQLDQIDGLLLDAKNEFAGQFNIGDIKLPTPYEVRRFVKASAAGLQYQSGQSPDVGSFGGTQMVSNTTTNINIDGADTAFILKVMTQYLGTTAVSRTSSQTRKA